MEETEDFKCYIYGSIHVKFPPLDEIGSVAGQVDYVLLEGVGLKKKGPLIPLTFPLWIAFYIYRRLFLCAVHWLHPRMRGKSDMKILKEFFESKGKPVEIADFEFYDLIKQKLREAFILSLLSFAIFIVLSHLLPSYSFPIYLILLLSCFIFSTLISFGIFVCVTKNDRDKILINRIIELRGQGHRCLFIARGEKHIPFIRKELSRLGITFTEIQRKGRYER